MTQANPLKHWDIYLDGNWIGLVMGHNLTEALYYARRHFPTVDHERLKVKYYGTV